MRRLIKDIAFRSLSRKARFTRIFRNNQWNSDESKSGSGSTLEATKDLRFMLPKLFEELDISSVLDAPCGDLNWAKEIVKSLKPNQSYLGMDIVDEIISLNTEQYSGDNVSFQVADVTSDFIPCVDIIVCNDLLIHLSYNDIRNTINNFRNSGSRYVMLNTQDDAPEFHDIPSGRWRYINLEKSPFNFPAPQTRIASNEISGKYLGLWELKALPDLAKKMAIKGQHVVLEV